MEDDRWIRVEQLCQEALDRHEQEQSAFLDSACGANHALRRDVESLLAHCQRAPSFLETSAVQMLAKALANEGVSGGDTSHVIGRVVSHYRIVDKIASGGMGDVYRALRADGSYDKQVAIKIIQGPRSTGFFLTRFHNERQILAHLDHPNIARLLDGGTTEEGLPYYVMEFVDGVRIDEFCGQRHLGIRARLDLFRAVCSAVHYAHQHLVVHRDLKPGNILVTSDGVPKLLDFGIAKILESQPGEASLQQTTGLLRMLTPDYASPEQVRNESISTSSDVYSLGVILYHLLTGSLPYRVSADSPRDMMHAICDTEPDKPSTAAVRHADRTRRDDTSKVSKLLAGDLDNIVLKALRKEPSRRYASVEQFSEDVRRYLTGLPVLAHQDSSIYRARKFIGRHRLAVAAAILLILSLSGGLVATLWQAHIARTERARAQHSFNDVRRLANFLIFEIHDGIRDLPGSTPVRNLIVERAVQYLDSLSQEAGGDPSLQLELAAAYDRLAAVQWSTDFANQGDAAASLRSYRKALAIRESLAAENPGDVSIRMELASEYIHLFDPLESSGDFQGALEMSRKGVSLAEAIGNRTSDPRSRTLQTAGYYYLGRILNELGDSAGALDSYRKGAATLENVHLANPSEVTTWKTHLAGDYAGMAEAMMLMGDYSGGIRVQGQAVQILEELSQSNPTTVSLRHFLANSYDLFGTLWEKHGDTAKALDYRRRAHELFSALLSSDPNDELAKANFGFSDESLAESLISVGDLPGALQRIHEGLAVFETMLAKGSKHRYVSSGIADCYFALGMAYSSLAARARGPLIQKKNWSEARSWLQKSADIWAEKRKQGSLDSEERETAGQVTQAISRCNTKLTGLGDVRGAR